jgi:hypothetical protein
MQDPEIMNPSDKYFKNPLLLFELFNVKRNVSRMKCSVYMAFGSMAITHESIELDM